MLKRLAGSKGDHDFGAQAEATLTAMAPLGPEQGPWPRTICRPFASLLVDGAATHGFRCAARGCQIETQVLLATANRRSIEPRAADLDKLS